VRRVAVCTDSTALFASGVAERLGVAIVPVGVTLDGEPCLDPDPDAFFERLSAGASATTSLPSPGDFVRAYEAAVASGAEEVLSVHVDSRMSATVASADLAAREVRIPVTVVDSGTVSFGLGACVATAVASVSSGASASAAGREARRVGRAMSTVFVTASAPGGRVPARAGWAVFSLRDGVVVADGVYDSALAAAAAMAARIVSGSGSSTRSAAVGHAATSMLEWADELAALLDADACISGVERYRVTPPVGAHTGPLSFGAFWWPDRLRD
jgi:DegV family protein with EDD domain